MIVHHCNRALDNSVALFHFWFSIS